MSVQDILLAQALQDNQNKPDPAVAMAVGGTVGAGLGAVAGMPLHYLGQGKLALQDQFNPHYAVTKRDNVGAPLAMDVQGAIPRHKLAKNRIRPGGRMAGGLVGLIAGGGLGGGLQQIMQQSSPAGDMLARIQANNGNLTAAETSRLEEILADTYSGMGL